MSQVADAVKLRSTPETVSWGWIAADRAPVLRVKSGQSVRIDTVTHQGINNKDDPVTYFGEGGHLPGESAAGSDRDIPARSSARRAPGPTC